MAIIALLVAIIVPYILYLRDEAWKTQSRNHLHNIGLALHNYHDVYSAFPPGGVIREDGVAMHGWCASVWPFIDSNPYFNMINFDVPWNDPENAHLFRLNYPNSLFHIPGADWQATSEGFDLTHYLGNPNILHRNSHIALDDLTAGDNHTWLAGEVAGHYQPRGYPFNWRPLSVRLNAGSESIGRPTGDGAFLLLGDGNVRFFANETDSAVLKALRNAPPQADRSWTQTPDRRFQYGDATEQNRRVRLDEMDGGLLVEVLSDQSGGAEVAVIMSASKLSARSPDASDVRRVAREFPQIRRLIGAPVIDDECAAVLAALPHLEFVKAPGIVVSDAGISSLTQLRHIELICVREIDDALFDQLKAALPDCTIRISPRAGF